MLLNTMDSSFLKQAELFSKYWRQQGQVIVPLNGSTTTPVTDVPCTTGTASPHAAAQTWKPASTRGCRGIGSDLCL